MQHRVYFGKGSQGVVTVPHRDGRPVRVASATYAIFDARFGDSAADHVVVAAGTVATVDPTSATLTGKAGRNAEDRRAITVTSTAGLIEGHTYLLTSTSGVVELVKVASVVSATVLLASAELRGDFGTGSTLKGVEVSGSFRDLSGSKSGLEARREKAHSAGREGYGALQAPSGHCPSLDRRTGRPQCEGAADRRSP